MDDIGDNDRGRLFRQARDHAESLRLAGVEWAPIAPRPTEHSNPRSGEEANESAARSLYPAAYAARLASVGDPGQNRRRETVPDAEAELFGAAETIGEPMKLEERRTALSVLAQAVAGCTRCKPLAATRTQTVFGVGKPGVELCFVGEAPGADEDAQGEPFVGAAGQLLNKIVAACGMKREDVYICNIIKCRPPGNRAPLPDEVGNCREYLEKQIELVRPRFLCALGSTAAQNLLGTTQSIGKLRGRFHSYKGIPTICTYHPAYLLPHRSPEKKKDVWEDMKMLLSRMGRPVG
jgi:uracil-DNA glycosylase